MLFVKVFQCLSQLVYLRLKSNDWGNTQNSQGMNVLEILFVIAYGRIAGFHFEHPEKTSGVLEVVTGGCCSRRGLIRTIAVDSICYLLQHGHELEDQ